MLVELHQLEVVAVVWRYVVNDQFLRMQDCELDPSIPTGTFEADGRLGWQMTDGLMSSQGLEVSSGREGGNTNDQG